jgi:hypothetical protein
MRMVTMVLLACAVAAGAPPVAAQEAAAPDSVKLRRLLA